MEPNTGSNLFELHIDQHVSSYLSESARWARFLAIVGFVMTGLTVLMGIFAGSLIGMMVSRMGSAGYGGATAGAGAVGGFFSFFYIAIALLYFFPCLYLFNFANKMQVAIRSNDQEQLGVSFRNLKSCFRFVGILMIIMLAFMALGIVFALIGAAFMR
jgi:hypothetical protein